MGSEFLLLWLLSMLLFPSSSEANCILDDVHGEVLPNYDPFHIKWKIDYEQDSIDIFISSADESLLNSREGYLALGLSEVGGMLGSDVMSVEFFEDQQPIVNDRYVPWVANPLENQPGPSPILDKINDWELLCAEMDYVDQKSSAVVRRGLDTKDDAILGYKEDRSFRGQNIAIIYAWGSHSFVYHGSKRGNVEISFVATESRFVAPSDSDESFLGGFSPGYPLKPVKTQYICQTHDVGPEVRHITAIEPIYSLTAGSPFIHHVLIHVCGSDYAALRAMNLNTTAHPCQAPGGEDYEIGQSPTGNGVCTSIIYVSASGSGPFIMPNLAGMKLGHHRRYIVFEVHIDNPQLLKGVEITNLVKIYTTSVLRPNDAGSMTVGDPAVTLPNIPIERNYHHFETSCSPSCTKNYPDSRVIFSSYLHMHKVGRQIWYSLTRFDEGGNIYEKSIVDYREYWNFAYQTSTSIDFVINPGDKLNVHCVYDTSKQYESVFFGQESHNEMCMAFLFYYPFVEFIKAQESNLCGYMEGITICDGELIWEQNPLPDGDQKLPRSLSFGPPENSVDAPYKWSVMIVGFLFGAMSLIILTAFFIRYHISGTIINTRYLQMSDEKIIITMAAANRTDGKYVGCGPDCEKHHKSKPVCLICHDIWTNHSGHMCANGVRGSFLVKRE